MCASSGLFIHSRPDLSLYIFLSKRQPKLLHVVILQIVALTRILSTGARGMLFRDSTSFPTYTPAS